MSAEELFKEPRRLKNLLKELDKADGERDGVIHRDVALQYIEKLREKGMGLEFLDAAKAFIEQGPEVQRSLSSEEIYALADVIKSPLPKAASANKGNGIA